MTALLPTKLPDAEIVTELTEVVVLTLLADTLPVKVPVAADTSLVMTALLPTKLPDAVIVTLEIEVLADTLLATTLAEKSALTPVTALTELMLLASTLPVTTKLPTMLPENCTLPVMSTFAAVKSATCILA